jgi:dihydrofolate reductase
MNERGEADMPRVIYSTSVSLDGFIAGPDGEIDWTEPDDELHRLHNDRVRQQGSQLLGRRLYETMLYWEGYEEREPEATETELDFARIWLPLPKVVFSRTLTEVQGTNTRLAQGTPAEEVERLKAQPGAGDIGVGGAGLAAELIAAGLVDEFHLFVAPVVLGAGTRYFPPLEHRIPLELVERGEFAGGLQYLRYHAL